MTVLLLAPTAVVGATETGRRTTRQPVRPAVIGLVNSIAREGRPGEGDIALDSLSANELRLVRNALFARYGYAFNDPALQQFFAAFPWYRPRGKVAIPGNDQQLATCIARFENARKGTRLQAPAVRNSAAAVEIFSDGTIRWRGVRATIGFTGAAAQVYSPDCFDDPNILDVSRDVAALQEPLITVAETVTRDGPILVVGYMGGLYEEDPPNTFHIFYRRQSGGLRRFELFNDASSPPRVSVDGTISNFRRDCDIQRSVIVQYTERYRRDAQDRYRSTGRENVRVTRETCVVADQGGSPRFVGSPVLD